MGLRGRDNSSSDIVKRVTTTSPSMKKKHAVVQREEELPTPISACSQTESIRSKIKRMGPICTARKKVVPLSPQLSTEEDFDFVDQLGKGRFSSDSLWLSSGSISPSSFLEEDESSSSFHLVADKWLVSWLSTILAADSYVSLSKGASLSDKSFADHIAERIKSSCGQCSDESTSNGNCLMISNLNLDEDDSQWISNPELELDYFESCFPSPPCKSFWGSEADSSTSTTINREDEITESNLSLHQTSEAENVEDFCADEPLFWPFDRKIEWKSEETWEYFSMSPRKEMIKVTTSEGTSPTSIGSELKNRNLNLPKSCRRKLVLNSGSTASKILELKQGSRGYNNSSSGRVKREKTMPSRLRESTKDSALDIENQILPSKVGEVPSTKSDLTSRNTWEDEFTSNEELSIETVLGLGEFDGHEGIDSEFNEGVFFLDETL